jgi:hypothetical protein
LLLRARKNFGKNLANIHLNNRPYSFSLFG